MVFKIGSTEAGDYSNRVIAGSYNVQTKPVTTSWEDANGVEHRQVIRAARTEGSFDMWFKTIEEYNTFAALVATTRVANQTVLCSVKSNTTDTLVTGNFFVDFAPVRNRRGDWSDIMERFTVTIKEA